jgi:ATP-binding cassette, subfamily B, bacterial
MSTPPARLPSTAYFIRRLLAYHPWPQVASGCCWILFHSWPLFPGLLAKAFFDLLQGRAPASVTLARLVALVVALALARIGFVYADTRVSPFNGMRVGGLLRHNLLTHMLHRPGAEPLPDSVGAVLSTLRDDVDTMFGAGWAFDVIGFVVFAGGGLAILLGVDARVTLLVFLPIIAVLAMAYTARTHLQRRRRQSRTATADVTGALGEVFGAVQAIQVAGAEATVLAHLQRLSAERQRLMLHDRLLGLTLDAVFSGAASLGAGLTLLAAAARMRSGAFTVGDFALFSTYLLQVTAMTGFLGWIVATYQQMGVAFARAVALLQGAPPQCLVAHQPLALRGPLPPLPAVANAGADRLAVLEVAGLTFRYPGSDRGVSDVSFTLRRGSITVVTGPIGAGKSTLLRVLLGLLQAQAGEVRWNGRRIADRAAFLVPPQAAYTPQTPTLLSGTLRENLLLGLNADDVAVQRAIDSAVLDGDLATFPAGLETLIGARGVRLSGGQIQRTAAARMFVREADLLVLDDLSSALDVETEQVLWQRLLERHHQTVLAVSHRPLLLRAADQIIVLKEGRVVAAGPPKGVLPAVLPWAST